MSEPDSLAVIKVGGSLFTDSRLGPALREWLDGRPEERLLLVPGGGDLANAVRGYHDHHHLSEELCHWLALRCLSINAHFLAELLPGSVIIPDALADLIDTAEARLTILDAFDFAQTDEDRNGSLEHSWQVTSDAIAARATTLSGATRLILLKSMALEPSVTWSEAASRGWVDGMFPEVATEQTVEWVNFREVLGD